VQVGAAPVAVRGVLAWVAGCRRCRQRCRHIPRLTADNRFDVPGWNLPTLRRFQFGDFRIELPTTTVIVETESAGGAGNLVKYWPVLRSVVLTKHLVILHVYMLSSDSDYIAHRKLWSFVVERMTEDLAANGIGRPGNGMPA
jgi:hypothetical protein